jgi:hypothetical protein
MSKINRLEGQLGELKEQLARKDAADRVDRAVSDLNLLLYRILQEAKIQNLTERSQAMGFLTDQFSQRTVRMWYVQRAITLASNEFNAILSAEASKSLDITGFLLFVGLTLLPEAGALAIVMKEFTDGDTEGKAFKTKWQPLVQALKFEGKAAEFGQRIVNLARRDGPTGQVGKAMESANIVLKKCYDFNLQYLVYIANLQSELIKMISNGLANPDGWLRSKWTAPILGPENASKLEKESDIISSMILYDILQDYTGKYVSISFDWVGFLPMAGQCITLDSAKLKEIPNRMVNVKGLNDHQREEIYQRFSTVPWADKTTRPPVSSWRDLISLWGAAVPGFQTDRREDFRCIRRGA